MNAQPRIFVSYAAPDGTLADAVCDFLRLGCNLAEEQIFCTQRPGTIAEGTSFTEAIREALRGAAMSIHLLTPSYYESKFCIAELGAVWIDDRHHVPLLVPPIDYASLDGVQLGEQALKLNRPRDLDELRDVVREVTGVAVPTAQWNRQRDIFMNKWDTELKERVALPTAVDAGVYATLERRATSLDEELDEVREARDRLQTYSRELKAQNETLRERVAEAPPPPELDESDETSRLVADARAAIEVAQRHMEALPAIVREGMFQDYHAGQPLTVGGYGDPFGVAIAREAVEQGYLTWREDEEQVATVRFVQPEVEAAAYALSNVRELVFEGSSYESRAEAPAWVRPFLKDTFGITDPTFELRPTWEAFGFL
jgi:hypothetical protein